MSGLRFALDDGPWQSWTGAATLTLHPGQTLAACLADGGHWYGHGFAHRQPYPLERETLVNEAFAVNNIQSPVWMASNGWLLFADTPDELSVGINRDGDGRLRIGAKREAVGVQVWRGANLPAVHREFWRSRGWPAPMPDRETLGGTIFCTWTQYPRRINQERVESMAAAIRGHGYPASLLTIDDRWESRFGELRFGPAFPDPRGMVDRLHALGFRVLLWVTPFVNRDAANFPELARRGVLVQSREGGAALLKWWGGIAGLVDLTRREGRDWYARQLRRLRDETGVDGFKIDGGDGKYQPPRAESRWHADAGASGYSDRLLEVCESIAPGLCETRTAWMSQGRRMLWRLGGKDSHWGLDNGLAAMVTLAMHAALLGYDILIPDMVPGRVQTLSANAPLPTDELMIRWTEASVLMPVLQFSYFPWNYGSDTAAVILAYARLHEALAPYVHEQACRRTAPLIRPLWYDWPDVQELYTVPDQFMLGGDLISAPVLREGARARDVRLPPGRWVDGWTGRMCPGGFANGWSAPCPGSPVFVRAENRALCRLVRDHLHRVPRPDIATGRTTTTHCAGLDRDLDVTG